MLALALLLPTLLKKHNLTDDDHQQRNIKIARQRLAELKQQLADNVLSQAQFDEQYTELQLMLNDDLQAAAETKPVVKEQGRWISLILLVLIPSVSLLIYELLGETNAVKKSELQVAETQAANTILQMVSKLEQRLQQNPDDLEGWKMLGRSYSYLQQYQAAADVFAQLNRRLPDDADIMLQYANSLAMARNGRMSGEPAELIDKVLKRQPDNGNALWLAGIAAAEQGKYAEAKQRWQKLLSLLPPDSESLPQVKQMLVALEIEEGKSNNEATTAAPVEIAVQVDIEPALKTDLPADSTVFIYAQAINGPKMPLAIVRKQLIDLPVKVLLNDAVAMQNGPRLGDQQQLRIVARVSRSGQAMTQPGDLIGSTELSQPFNTLATVTINQKVK